MKATRIAGLVMFWAGALVIAFLVYQFYGTGVLTSRAQSAAVSELESRFESVRSELTSEGLYPNEQWLATSTTVESANGGPAMQPLLYPEPVPDEGVALGFIRIPDIGVDSVILEGVLPVTLKDGPGHMPWTPIPGQPGNAVISGHRTTYGAPFGDLDALEAGDEIVIETAIGSHRYVIRELFVVTPTDVWVTNPKRGAWLTLTTCHPRFSAKERLIVQAELVEGPNYPYAQAQLEEFLEPMS